jgi:hypothetical protein
LAPSLKISRIIPATPADWEAACRSCDYATFFHTPQWAECAGRYQGLTKYSVAHTVVFNDGMTAVLPTFVISKFGGLIKTTYLSAYGTYGGWVSSSPLTKDHASLLAGHICKNGSVIWRENPLDPVVAGINIPGAGEDYTHLFDLRKSEEALYAASSHAHHKALKKAISQNIQIRMATTADEWNAYHTLYQASLDRWHKQEKSTRIVYGKSLFALLQSFPEHCKLWLAYKEQVPIAGIVCFYWNHHMVAWHGAASDTGFDARPNNLLYWDVMKNAKASGYWWFDCNPSGSYPGVVQFKEHLGAQKVRSRVYSRTPVLRSLASRVRRMISLIPLT